MVAGAALVLSSAVLAVSASAQVAPGSAASAPSLARVAPAGHPLLSLSERRFDAAAGLRATTVFAMAFDTTGVPWVGGDNGLFVYAGGLWRDDPLPPEFEKQEVRSLLFAADGTQWIGTRRGLLRRRSTDSVEVYRDGGGLVGSVVYSLAQSAAIDGSERVVAGTSRGVSYHDGTRMVPLALPSGFAPIGVMVASMAGPDGQAELWVANSTGGVARYGRGVWTLYGPEQGLRTPDSQFLLPSPGDTAGRLYVAGSEGVFVLRRAPGGEAFVRLDGSPRNATRLAWLPRTDGARELWVGSVAGRVTRWHDGRWSEVRAAIGERHGTVTLLSAAPGHGGGTAIYASSRGGYLSRLSYSIAGTLPLTKANDPGYVTALHAERGENGRDDLWIATHELGLRHMTSTGAVTAYPFGAMAPGGAVDQVTRVSLAPPGRAMANDGTLVVVARGVPWRFTGSGFVPFAGGLQGGDVHQLRRLRQPDGVDALLAATSRGLRQWDGARWRPVYPQVDRAVHALTAGVEGRRRVLYVGGPHEVLVVDSATVQVESIPDIGHVATGNGVVRRLCSVNGRGARLLLVHESERGVFWRPAASGQTWRLLPPQIQRELRTVGITDVQCLPSGRVAIGTFSKVLVLDVGDGQPASWRLVTQVSDADGLPSSATVSVAESGTPGVLWVGTELGLGVVNVAAAAALPQSRLLMRVTAVSGARPVPDGAVLTAANNDLQVDPLLLAFHREEDTRIRLRLRPSTGWGSAGDMSDTTGSEWLDGSTRVFSDLAPGAYELSAWAIDWAGREYGPVHRTFTIRTPLWRTPVALLAYAVALAALLTAAYRWRVQLIRDGSAQLLASERRARDSERRFRAIFEQALDGHLLLEDGRVQAANAVAARLFGAAAPDALEQQPLTALLAVGGDIPSSTTPREATIARAEGAVPVQYTVTDVPSASRLLQHVVVRDLTEVRKAEAERAWFEAQVREAQKLESLGTLAGGVAHDFNNVLGVIRGNAELARTALRKGRSNDDNLSAILDASDRARDIVRQILTFSRRSSPTREYVNLSRLVLDLQPLLRRMVPRTIRMVVEGADRPHLLMGDPTQLQQLLLNLVSNAEYAMRAHTDGVLTIALSGRTVPASQAAPTGDVVVLAVRDTGSGMSAEVRARIFEPFFTTKPTGEGTGLGMAVVHGIVVSHQGRAEVMSEPGLGTTFELRFPRAVIEGLWDEDTDPTALLEPEDPAADPPTSRNGASAEEDEATVARLGEHELGDVLTDSAFAGTTIVVVDDDPAVARVVERALQHYGHLVRVFVNPEPALAFIREQPSAVDLLITDQTMPGMTGDMLAEAVHGLRRELPVLILTGFSHRLTPVRIAAAQAHAVLLKPVELVTLKQAVDDALTAVGRGSG